MPIIGVFGTALSLWVKDIIQCARPGFEYLVFMLKFAFLAPKYGFVKHIVSPERVGYRIPWG